MEHDRRGIYLLVAMVVAAVLIKIFAYEHVLEALK